MLSYPSRVRIGSQTGTAMRRSSRNDDAAYTTYLSHEGWVPLLEPRSLVRWDAGFLTSTADRALELVGEDGDSVEASPLEQVRQGTHPSVP